MTPKIVFLDNIPQAQGLGFTKFVCSTYFIASSAQGIKSFKEEKKAESDACLLLWIDSLEKLKSLSEIAKGLNPLYIFALGKLKPSEIISQGSYPSVPFVEIPDPRSSTYSELINPQSHCIQKASVNNPQASVIIPFFDNYNRTLKSLNSWLKQDHASYEIIIVDDGSPQNGIKDLQGLHLDKLTLVQLSRPKHRQRGDYNFRAGIARNLGFLESRGASIIFSDSDIIVPPDTLKTFESALKASDLVMPQRWQLNSSISEDDLEYSKLDFNRHTILSPGAHWEYFQTNTPNWQQIENPWKWTSTFCLGVKSKTLEALGAFNRSFVSYGFEDTELGYRIYKSGGVFSLLPLKTYHLHQPATHSEYQNDLKKKQLLLRISADRFFRHHPTKEVYEAIQNWLD